LLLPPSSFAVFYGLLTQESIAGLLMAGIGPGILLTVLYAAMLIAIITIRPSLAPRETERLSFGQRVRGLAMTWELVLAFAVIIGGVIAGVFTVTESAGVGTLIILVMAAIRSKMDWRKLWTAFTETVAAMGMLFLLLAAARIFSKFIVASGVTQWVVDWILSLRPGPVVFLFAVAAMYLVLGTFMESLSILILTVPVLYPAVDLLGIEPLWFFAVVMVSIELGLLTPPLGMNIFGVKAVAEPDVKLEDIQLGALPFAAMVVVTAVVVILVPPIANWIPLHMAAP
jgi:tripartite ATP-independent transporter DctM subunit